MQFQNKQKLKLLSAKRFSLETQFVILREVAESINIDDSFL